MKCNHCGVDVSPNFVLAIKKNSCPACGQRILEDDDFSTLMGVEGTLKVLNKDDDPDLSVKVAATLVGNFDITPKEGVELPKVKTATKNGFVSMESSTPSDPLAAAEARRLKVQRQLGNMKSSSDFGEDVPPNMQAAPQKNDEIYDDPMEIEEDDVVFTEMMLDTSSVDTNLVAQMTKNIMDESEDALNPNDMLEQYLTEARKSQPSLPKPGTTKGRLKRVVE